jgi:hypothetical protein
MSKLLFVQGGLYVLIGTLTPIPVALASNIELTGRVITGLVISSILAGATALKAFLSTNFAESKASEPDKPLP